MRIYKPGDDCEGCEARDCQHCCPHDEREHFICIDCEKEFDPGEAIDAAMDHWEALNE